MQKVYLDYSATTPLSGEVNDAMHAWGKSDWGNPSSPHRSGQQAKFRLEEVREHLAMQVGCKPKEIVFTSGGTESNNLALIGRSTSAQLAGKHIIISAVEHPSVLACSEYLQSIGFDVSRVYPDEDGKFSIEDFKNKFRSDTILVSMMYVNNETGVIHPVSEIGTICREQGITFHCDAVQGFGKIPVQMQHIHTDLLSISAHKIYGPKGIGALVVREGTEIKNLLFGGGQEANRRPGTENMTGIIGFGTAIKLLKKYSADFDNAVELRNYFEEQLKQSLPKIKIIGEDLPRSPFISCIAFPGIDNQSLLLNLDLAGIAVSVGSACSSGSIKQSHVLKAMDLPELIINSAVRFSFGRFTEKDGMDYTLEQLDKITKRMQQLS